MNILVVNWRCIKNPEMGGAEVHLHEIFKRVVKKGHKVTLVAHKFPGSLDEEVIDSIKILRHGNKYLFNKQFKNYYKKELADKQFDLVVDDISKIPLNTPKYINKPVVGILHHIHGNSLYKEVPFPIAYYIVKKEKQIPEYYSETPIFTVSNSTKEELINFGFPEEKIGILHNAIEHDLFDKVGINKSPTPLLVYVGRIKKYKNIDKVIAAIEFLKKDFPEIRLKIGGKGDYLDQLKNHVKEKNLSKNVEFVGFLSEEEKAELLGNAWLFLTMAEKEGWGITVIEANAMKTPAIGSNVPGLRDSIRNEVTGYLVQPGNSNQLAEKVRSLLLNKSVLNQISENAFKWSKEFSWDKSAEHFVQQVYSWYPELKTKN